MKTSFLSLVFLAVAVLAFSCQPQSSTLTDSQKAAIADSTKALLRSMLASSDKLDFQTALQLYSAEADARYVENGVIFRSLDAMKKAYAEFAPILESLQNNVDAWDVMVLGADVVSFTLPIHFSIKAKGRPEYKGQCVWSGVVQRRGGTWKMVQTHESWVNPEQAMAAIMGPPAKQERAKK